jgi:hypothetical protein
VLRRCKKYGVRVSAEGERAATNSEFSQLPWEQLQNTEGGVPWPALRTFADAVATDPGAAPKLFEVYDQAYKEAFQQNTYTDFYVAAIFALAAPRLDEERRREIGTFLVERLVQAGRDDMDISLEVLQAAAGTMGPVILPAVLEAIAREPDTRGAWFFLWSLLRLATKSDDETLRQRAMQACVDLLEKVERGEADPGDGMSAAWTLASFQRPEHTDLLQRLSQEPMERWWIADYRGALQLHQGQLEYTRQPEFWEEPVEEWLTSRCRLAEESAAETAETPEPVPPEPEDPETRFARALTDGFLASPIATSLPQELLLDASMIVYDLVLLSRRHLRTGPRDWDEGILREILLVLLPRETSLDREQLRKVAPLTEAFLYWLRTEGLLTDADTLAAQVRTWGDEIIAAGMNRKNWGPIKTFAMEAQEAGPDAITEEKLIEFLTRQVFEATESRPKPPKPARPPSGKLPIPIVEQAAQPARNAPCPCGSGKKYKKCHGRPSAEQLANR